MFVFVVIAQLKQDNYIANKQQMKISIASCALTKRHSQRGLVDCNQDNRVRHMVNFHYDNVFVRCDNQLLIYCCHKYWRCTLDDLICAKQSHGTLMKFPSKTKDDRESDKIE